MPFYDAYTKRSFSAIWAGDGVVANQQGMRRIRRSAHGCAGRRPVHHRRAYVRLTYPTTRFEVLYPPDANDTTLNTAVNLPATYGHRPFSTA